MAARLAAMNQSTATCRVVVVDDNRGFRLAAEMFLRSLASVEFVGAARNGVEGLDLISELKPTAAIIDISMPGMSGFELAAKLRKRPDAPGIILVSMHVDEATRLEAQRLGVDAVVPKVDFVFDLPAALQAVSSRKNRNACH